MFHDRLNQRLRILQRNVIMKAVIGGDACSRPLEPRPSGIPKFP